MTSRPALGALALVACSTALVLALVGAPFYHTNDDPVMSCIVAGVSWIGGESHPAEQAVFVHVWLGRALVALYRAAPGVPWYGLLLLSALLTAAGGCAFAGLRLAPPRLASAAWLLFAALVCGLGLTTLHFGVCATFLAASGLLLGLSLLARPSAGPRTNGALSAWAVLQVLLAFALRPEGALLGLCALSPLALMQLPRSGRRRAAWFALGLLACLAGAVSLRARQRQAYARSPGWEQTLDWMEAKTAFIDHARIAYTERTRATFEAAAWSANDLELLRRWFAWDPQLYSTASLRDLEARLHRAGGVPPHNLDARGMRGALVTPLSLGALGLALALGWGGRRREAGMLALAAAFECALVLAIGAGLRTPPLRVHMPLWLLACGLPVFALLLRQPGITREPFGARQRQALLAGLGVLAVVATLEAAAAHDLAARREQRGQAARRDLERLARLPGPPLLLNWAGLFPMHDLVRPLDPFRGDGAASRYASQSFFWIGWPVRLPINALWLERRGARDVYTALVERDDLVLLTQPLHLPVLERALLERRGWRVTHRLVLVGETVTAYRLERAAAPPP
jgi:hypothetical protein